MSNDSLHIYITVKPDIQGHILPLFMLTSVWLIMEWSRIWVWFSEAHGCGHHWHGAL